jgi:hypothetical protein
MTLTIIIVFFAMALIIGAWLYCELVKEVSADTAESTYNLTYSMIQSDIDRAKLTLENYHDIDDKIERLSKLPGNNPEKTVILDLTFRIKFERFIDEHSPEEIFTGE